MAIVINGSTGITATESSNLLGNGVVEAADLASGAAVSNIGYTPANQSNVMGRNRIINGDMRIDQRNAGASASLTSSNIYFLDRWIGRTESGSGNTVQQDATAPSGFTNSQKITIGTGASPSSGHRNYVFQNIEGFNTSDLNFGQASASTITISFWVRSSLTGTFGGALQNSANDRSYAFTYSISSANTFEYKTVSIAGDTTGTWLTNNNVGLRVYFDLGTGTTGQTSAGSWASGDYRAPSGCVQVVATSGATFYITGVQLEVGSVATEFERRPYGTELALCQRYCWRPITSGGQDLSIGWYYSGSHMSTLLSFPTTMRTSPTMTAGSGYNFYRNGGADSFNNLSLEQANTNNALLLNNTEMSGTAGQAGLLRSAGSTSVIFSAEL